MEALWVTWGLNKVDEGLLKQMLESKDFRARAAAVRVVRYNGHQLKNQADLLMQAAKDEHGRVRLEAIVAASWLPKDIGMPIVQEAGKKPLDEWLIEPYAVAVAHLGGKALKQNKNEEVVIDLTGPARESYIKGKAIYNRDGHCGTCHQPDVAGLPASGFPRLNGNQRVQQGLVNCIKKM